MAKERWFHAPLGSAAHLALTRCPRTPGPLVALGPPRPLRTHVLAPASSSDATRSPTTQLAPGTQETQVSIWRRSLLSKSNVNTLCQAEPVSLRSTNMLSKNRNAGPRAAALTSQTLLCFLPAALNNLSPAPLPGARDSRSTSLVGPPLSSSLRCRSQTFNKGTKLSDVSSSA